MQLSLVLYTYNGARFLPAQLDSLLAQTRLPDEVIAYDDVSSDNSIELLGDFATRMHQRGVNVCLHQHPANMGFVQNFSGDVVFLCDQDDVWHADKIERMAAEFARRPQLLLLHADAHLIDADGQPLGHTLFDALEFTKTERQAEHTGAAFDVLLNRNTVTGATAAFRRSLIERALPVADGWIHDEWLAICASLHGEVDCLDWACIDYRQHGDNQIGIRKYSPWERMTRRTLSKREHMQRVASRLHTLLAHQQIGHMILNAAQHHKMQERAAHAHFRANLSTRLWPRTRGVLAEALTGRYRRHSAGLRSIASDLLNRGG